MKKSFSITVPEPCHEDWNKMSPTEKGKFCDQCAKEVTDFTRSTDEEIVKTISVGNKVCGRFKNTQLNREIKLERKSNNSLLPYAASLLLPLSILSLQEAKSQGGATTFVKSSIALNSAIHSTTEKAIITATGEITDANGNPIKNAEVIVLETGARSRSNLKGEYTIKCASGSTLFFLKNDMRSSEYTLGNRDTTIHVILKPKHYKVSIITGAIRTVPVETIGKIKHEVDLLEILKNKAAICGLEVKDEKTKETASKITISGTIRDEAQLILPGVNVLIKGTSKGTQTDFKGNYSIETEPNSVLEFSFLGYENKEIALSNISNEVSFSMTPNFEELAGTIGFMIIREESSMYVDPYARDSYLDHDQRSNRKRRKEYAAKENAFKKIKRSRDKAARLIKRALKNKK